MKKVILALIVIIVVLSFTLPLYAWPLQGVPATSDSDDNPADPDVQLDHGIGGTESQWIKWGGDHTGGNDPSKGLRAREIQKYLGH